MNAFPESDYAVAVADPNYEYNIRMMDVVQDSIYQATYDRYLESDTAYVRKSFRYVSEKYPLATLMLNSCSWMRYHMCRPGMRKALRMP